MSKRYVPDETYLVCSDGMKMQPLKVTSQTTIKITGKLAATEEDRTGDNFVCAKMVVAGAIIGAVVAGAVAAATIATGGLAGAALIGAAAVGGAVGGAALGLGLGSIPCACALLTMGGKWTPVHQQVSFEGKRPLLESSTITCFFGGQILIFYSKEAAQEAVDLRQKKTLANVGLIAASAFVVGAVFQGVATAVGTGSGILSQFGWRAFGNYLGGVAYSGVGSFAGNWALDEGKNMIYEKIGIKDEIDGYNTDITEYQFEDINDVNIKDREEFDTQWKLETGVKVFNAGQEGSEITHKNAVSNVQNIHRTDYARLDDIQEIGHTSTTTNVGIDEDAIQSKHAPKSLPSEYEVQNRDFGGRYQDGYIQQIDVKEQYKMQDNSVHLDKKVLSQGAGKQFVQGAKKSLREPLKERRAFLLSLLPDLYKFIVNPLIADELQDYLEAMRHEEAKARAGINVKTDNY